MGTIGLFYASETGNTRKIAKLIQRDHFGDGVVELHPVEQASAELVGRYRALIFGTPKVADGEYPEELEACWRSWIGSISPEGASRCSGSATGSATPGIRRRRHGMLYE